MDPLGDVIVAHGVDHHIYADDTQLYFPVSLRDCESVKSNLSVLMQKIKSWMSANKLKFIDDKTELIIFRKKTKSATIDDITINNNVIQRSKSVRNSGFYLDEFLNMQSHISKLCQLIHCSLRNIGHVRNLIDDETCKMLVHSLITSRMDYCNSLLYGLPKNSIARLQLLQNKTARIVAKSKKSNHIAPVLQS